MTMPLDSLSDRAITRSRVPRAPDEASRILLAAAEMIERKGLQHGWEVSRTLREATERVMGTGPVKANIWFERTLGRLFRHERTKLPGKRTSADWAARCRAAAELEPLENPRWPPYEGW